MSASDSLQSLSSRAASGDLVALKVVLSQTRSDLCTFISRRIPKLCQSLIDAEDIVQMAHMRIFQKLATVDTEHSHRFDRWVRAIALNCLRSAVRACRTIKRDVTRQKHGNSTRARAESSVVLLSMLAGGLPTGSQVAVSREAVSMLETALPALPRHYQQAIRLVHLEGLSVRQVAGIMGRSERAVQALCRRGLTQLRYQLGPKIGLLSAG